jgi:S1-C subfamily serine protease
MDRLKVILLVLVASTSPIAAPLGGQQNISAPMTTDLTGQTFPTATNSVYRILCPKKNRSGTGFLHQSGRIITAAHVVAECKSEELVIITGAGKSFSITNIVSDTNIDVAVLMPAEPLLGQTFRISTNELHQVGEQVCTWGFPAGYSGFAPLLSVGYLSGKQQFNMPHGKQLTREIVNAAFNGGNSGGPLLNIETHEVIGVVVSKLAPLPRATESAIAALHASKYGLQYAKRNGDGTTNNISEAQLLAEVIDYLRSQVQLVIGYATTSKDLREFLQTQGITP